MKNPFRSKKKTKERVFDPNPKMKAQGTAYITKLTMTEPLNKTTCSCIAEHLIFSDIEVPNEQIMEMPIVENFIQNHRDGSIEKVSFECELRSVKTENLIIPK